MAQAIGMDDAIRDLLADAYDEFRANGRTWLPCGAYACDPLIHNDGWRFGSTRCSLVLTPEMDETTAVAQARAAGLTVSYVCVERRFQ